MITVCVFYSENNKCVGQTKVNLPFLKNSDKIQLIALKPQNNNVIEFQAFDAQKRCISRAQLTDKRWCNKFLAVKDNTDSIKGACEAFFSEQYKNIYFFPVESKDLQVTTPPLKESKKITTDNDFSRQNSFFIPWQNLPSRDVEGAKTPPLEEEPMEVLGDPPKLIRQSSR